MGGTQIEPDVENVVDLLPVLVRKSAEEALARARPIPRVGAFAFECVCNALIDAFVQQDFDRVVVLFPARTG